MVIAVVECVEDDLLDELDEETELVAEVVVTIDTELLEVLLLLEVIEVELEVVVLGAEEDVVEFEADVVVEIVVMGLLNGPLKYTWNDAGGVTYNDELMSKVEGDCCHAANACVPFAEAIIEADSISVGGAATPIGLFEIFTVDQLLPLFVVKEA